MELETNFNLFRNCNYLNAIQRANCAGAFLEGIFDKIFPFHGNRKIYNYDKADANIKIV